MHGHNGMRTALLLAVMSGLILFAGHLVGGARGLLFALILALGVNGFAFYSSDKIALRAMRARPVGEAE